MKDMSYPNTVRRFISIKKEFSDSIILFLKSIGYKPEFIHEYDIEDYIKKLKYENNKKSNNI